MSIIQGLASTAHFDDRLFDGDSEFLAEVVGLFLRTCPDLLSEIETAVVQQDGQGLRKAAHTFKGAVANFGAKAVVVQAQTLERIGTSGNLSGAETELTILQALVAELLPELQAALARVADIDT